MPNLASHTASHSGGYPEYVSIGVLDDHVTICVRSPTVRGQPGPFASMKMSRAAFGVLLETAQRNLRNG